MRYRCTPAARRRLRSSQRQPPNQRLPPKYPMYFDLVAEPLSWFHSYLTSPHDFSAISVETSHSITNPAEHKQEFLAAVRNITAEHREFPAAVSNSTFSKPSLQFSWTVPRNHNFTTSTSVMESPGFNTSFAALRPSSAPAMSPITSPTVHSRTVSDELAISLLKRSLDVTHVRDIFYA